MDNLFNYFILYRTVDAENPKWLHQQVQGENQEQVGDEFSLHEWLLRKNQSAALTAGVIERIEYGEFSRRFKRRGEVPD